MKKLNKWLTKNLPWLILAGVALLCALFIAFGQRADDGSITLDGQNASIAEETKQWIEEAQKNYKSAILYSSEEIPAVLEDGTTLEVPTVESIDDPETEEGTVEGGRGAYVYAPTGSYKDFENYTIDKCWNVDGAYGSQCWDLGALFWMNYTEDGRSLSTCGTGAAKGAWSCKEQNAGNDFELIYDATALKAGDWVIFGGGTWGHVGMALGGYNNGYVALFGQNQGGASCPGGGATANIINMSTATFLGAFRPKTYIDPTPVPVPTPSEGITYTYVSGDYFSKVLVGLGLDEGNLWGDSGTVRYYTGQLMSQNMLDARGNVLVGVPFTLIPR